MLRLCIPLVVPLLAVPLLVPLVLGALAGCSEGEPTPPAQEPASGTRAKAPVAGTSADSEPVATPSDPTESLFGFETRDHQLFIHSTDDGPLYTVKTRDGRVVAEGIDEATLAASYPELHDVLNNGIHAIGYAGERIDY